MGDTLYFHYHSDVDTISVFTDRAQNHGGMMQPGEGYGGNPIEAFKKAVAGKMVAREDGTYLIKPMPGISLAPA